VLWIWLAASKWTPQQLQGISGAQQRRPTERFAFDDTDVSVRCVPGYDASRLQCGLQDPVPAKLKAGCRLRACWLPNMICSTDLATNQTDSIA